MPRARTRSAERRAAHDLFRIALYDGETVVRRVLAESLKHARDLPRDIVRRLAQDVPEVSAPFLAASPLLGDEDLMPIAKCGATAQRTAIAGRPRLVKARRNRASPRRSGVSRR